MAHSILLLEDDPLFGDTICEFLEDEGFEVELVRNGNDAINATFTKRFSLYLLDINVPAMSGIELLKELRGGGDNTPAFYLTSHQERDKLAQGFEAGADEYMRKPVDLDEMLMRIKAVLRRSYGEEQECFGLFCFDKSQKELYKNGKIVKLAPKERELFALLFQEREKSVSKERMFSVLWSPSESVNEGSIRVYIRAIKKALDESVSIENIRGVGYRMHVN